jgi:hypothetical protein
MMQEIKKLTVTLKDGTVVSYAGHGQITQVNTTQKLEVWSKDDPEAKEPDVHTVPVSYLTVGFSPQAD